MAARSVELEPLVPHWELWQQAGDAESVQEVVIPPGKKTPKDPTREQSYLKYSRSLCAFVIGFVSVAFLASLVVMQVEMGKRTTVHADNKAWDAARSHGWVLQEEEPHPDEHLLLIFAIKQDTDAIYKHLSKVSHPSSSHYGQYLSLEELKDLAESREDSARVHKFVQQHSVIDAKLHPAGDFLTVNITVFHANKMLDTTFQAYRNRHSQVTALRAKKYSLPAKIAESIDLIVNALHLPHRHERPKAQPVGTQNAKQTAGTAQQASNYGLNSGLAYPQLVFKYYGMEGNLTVAHPNSSFGIFETNSQAYMPEDILKYDKQYNLPEQRITTQVGENDEESCKHSMSACDEASLDVQLGTGAAQGAKTTVYSIPAKFEAFLTWASSLSSEPNPPLVHSISYLWTEIYVPEADARRFDVELGKLGLRGITVITVSGDDGAPGYGARGKPDSCGISTAFPGGCPHITVVGATQGPESGSKTEVVCQADKGGTITSGGGFSAYFTRPAWQEDAVAYYISSSQTLPDAKYKWNTKGRGYPDVALIGAHFPIVISGSMYDISGTSGSAPLFAAMVVLINAERMKMGKPPLGYLNELLYMLAVSNPEVFFDVVTGETSCTMQGCCPGAGFGASKGWDPATGLGSVNYKAFLEAAKKL